MFAIWAAVLFTVCNSAIAEISRFGIVGMLYFCIGTFLCGAVYFSFKLRKYGVTSSGLWDHFKFYDFESKVFIGLNIFGFCMFALDYFIY